MNKRPKSREETPKEGSDSARRYRTATICNCNAPKASIFKEFAMFIVRNRLANHPAMGLRNTYYFHALS